MVTSNRISSVDNLPQTVKHLDWTDIHFIKSVLDHAALPRTDFPEVAFSGRSNVGKSSLINGLVGRTIARRSKSPGRTQALNYFELVRQFYLVDLPGYGFAKVPASVQQRWQKLISEYLSDRETLCGLVLVVDSRHPPQKLDYQMLAWALQRDWPMHVVLNKIDTLSRQQFILSEKLWQKEFFHDHPQITWQSCSALRKIGMLDLQQKIETWLK